MMGRKYSHVKDTLAWAGLGVGTPKFGRPPLFIPRRYEG
jgi:hypothetical protein